MNPWRGVQNPLLAQKQYQAIGGTSLEYEGF